MNICKDCGKAFVPGDILVVCKECFEATPRNPYLMQPRLPRKVFSTRPLMIMYGQQTSEDYFGQHIK